MSTQLPGIRRSARDSGLIGISDNSVRDSTAWRFMQGPQANSRPMGFAAGLIVGAKFQFARRFVLCFKLTDLQ